VGIGWWRRWGVGDVFEEAAALRWRHLDATMDPLWRLLVATSYSRRERRTTGTKTGATRAVPVHPTLAKILAAWQIGGWARMLGQPTGGGLDDLLIPSRRGIERSTSHGLKRFHEDLERVGLRPRRLHDLRRTFISLCRDDGASRDVLRWVTHAPPKEAFDTYTTFAWATVCAEVGKLRVELREPGEVRALRAGGSTGLVTVLATAKENPRNS
jgi:integrase